MSTWSERFGDKVDAQISGTFARVGRFVGNRPRWTIFLCFLVTILCGAGFATWETENRGEELWVPQGTTAEKEKNMYLEDFPPSARVSQLILTSDSILTKETLVEAMQLHQEIETKTSTLNSEEYTFTDLCVEGKSCEADSPICDCFITSILRVWNYNLETLQADNDVLGTLNAFYTNPEDLESVLGGAVFENGSLVSAEAMVITYFNVNREVVVDGDDVDPINEAWEEQVFLDAAERVPEDYSTIEANYFATRSFEDEFGAEISGDLLYVQISYLVAFLFLGASLGRIKCGTGSRWSLAFAALVTVGLSTAAGFGLSSLFGLFYGPIHALLPFVLLGIGIDDCFVLNSSFDRERKVPRASESNEDIAKRCERALARAGASITVTSLTDLVAFAISSTSGLPALASFCAYAAISIFFLWFFAATFFAACFVLDERRQRDNRRECLCCFSRKGELEEDEGEPGEGVMSNYFRKYHSPVILSKAGKVIVILIFGALLGFGLYGATNLAVEDSGRNFVPEDSYLNDYLDASDEYFPDQGNDLFIVFEGSSSIYQSREELAMLDTRVSDLSEVPPYLAEPTSEETYRNVMSGLKMYLNASGTSLIGGAPLGTDGWPSSEEDFVSTLKIYASIGLPGARYAQDLSLSEDETSLQAYQVKLQYVKLTKEHRGKVIDDAEKQIDAMDTTRSMIKSWTDLPPAYPYCEDFPDFEGYKVIRKELFTNVGLAIGAVAVIVFFTVASPMTSLLITLNVAFCIVEILGFMYAVGIVIDSVSVINIVLAVGLSVDYSAHIGHCFMTKGGKDKNRRATESLADMGSVVISGGLSTFLAVAVLLFSSSYVFVTLSRQFALTVSLGLLHGLVLLPVLLAIFGPKPFSSAEKAEEEGAEKVDAIAETGHASAKDSSDEE